MSIEDYFWVIIIVVGFVLSGLNKLVERSRARRRMYEERMQSTHRRSDEPVRAAQRRMATPATPIPSATPQLDDVIRRLMGEESGRASDGPSAENDESGGEEDWRPIPPPSVRRAPPPQPERRPAQRVQPAMP